MIVALDRDDPATAALIAHLEGTLAEPVVDSDTGTRHAESVTQVLLRRSRVTTAMARQWPGLRRAVVFGRRSWLVDADVDVTTVPRRSLRRTAEHALHLLLIAGHRRHGTVVTPQLAGAVDSATSPGNPYGVLFRGTAAGPVQFLTETPVGIVGAGDVALELALLVRTITPRTSYWSRTPLPGEVEQAFGLHAARSLEELLAANLAVVVAVGPTDEPVLGRRELARVAPGAIVVNIARPGSWDAGAVLDALLSGHLGGAATDVLGPGLSRIELRQFVEVAHVTPLVAGGPVQDLDDEFEAVGAALRAVLP